MQVALNNIRPAFKEMALYFVNLMLIIDLVYGQHKTLGRTPTSIQEETNDDINQSNWLSWDESFLSLALAINLSICSLFTKLTAKTTSLWQLGDDTMSIMCFLT